MGMCMYWKVKKATAFGRFLPRSEVEKECHFPGEPDIRAAKAG
jgi:hypothetical protein